MIQFGSVFVIVLFGYVLVRSVVRARPDPRQEWPALLSSLQPLDTAGLSVLAEPSMRNYNTDPLAKEAFCNGSEDIICLMTNAEAVLRLAAYAGRWSRELSDATLRDLLRPFLTILFLGYLSRLVAKLHYGRTPTIYLRSIALAYTSMLTKIEGLYGVVHVGRYPALKAALHAGCGI